MIPPAVAAELDQLSTDLSDRLAQSPEFWAAEKLAYDAAYEQAVDAGCNASQANQYASTQSRPTAIDARRFAGQTEAVRVKYEHLKFMVEHGAV